MMRDLPDPQGSMRYLEASTIPLTPPSITGPSGCSTDVSTMTHAPLGKSVLQDLSQIQECHWYSNRLFILTDTQLKDSVCDNDVLELFQHVHTICSLTTILICNSFQISSFLIA